MRAFATGSFSSYGMKHGDAPHALALLRPRREGPRRRAQQ
jgi:hypothetical protein